MLTARWVGEGLREAAVLIMVFVPLDWMLGRRESRWEVSGASFFVAVVVFAVGIALGIRGESDDFKRE